MFPYGKGLGKEKYLLAEQGQSHFCRIKNISAGLSYHENMFHIGISLFFFLYLWLLDPHNPASEQGRGKSLGAIRSLTPGSDSFYSIHKGASHLL